MGELTAPRPGFELVRSLRPRQWVKNLLVVAAPLASGRLLEPTVFAAMAIAFVAFCLAASAVYLCNDVRDVDEDRAHPLKRHRPIAAGTVRPGVAVGMASVLGLAALGVAALAEPGLVLVIAGYLVLALGYTFALQDEPVFDLAIVAAGFLLRAMAGGVAAGIPLSQWFLLTAAFGSLFMVAGKRASEVALVGEGETATRRSLAGYTAGYLRSVWTIALTVTVATYALWAFEMAATFERPVLAQLSIAPFVLAGLRYALDIDRGGAGDPVEIVLHDRGLQALGLLWVVLFATGVSGV